MVTFCPLCNTALVFERTLDGVTYDFGTTGKLRFSDLVMYDRQTKSWWQQAVGEAIVGELTGAKLAFLPAQIVSLDAFAATWPEGDVLSRDTGNPRPYGRNPYPGYDTPEERPFLFEGSLNGRVAPKERVVAVAEGGESIVFRGRCWRRPASRPRPWAANRSWCSGCRAPCPRSTRRSSTRARMWARPGCSAGARRLAAHLRASGGARGADRGRRDRLHVVHHRARHGWAARRSTAGARAPRQPLLVRLGRVRRRHGALAAVSPTPAQPRIELLWFQGCPNHVVAREMLASVVAELSPGSTIEDIGCVRS